MKTAKDILKAVAEDGVKFISLEFTDIVGRVKSIVIPVSELAGCLENGVWFDGSSIEGFARIAESDMYLMPDLDTYAVVPWSSGSELTARLICNVHTPSGDRFVGDPRYVLSRVLAQVEEMGLTFSTGPELEFFLFEPDGSGCVQPLNPHDQAGYFDVPTDLAIPIKRQMVTALQAFGIRVEAAHHEVATGQHEIDFRYSDALCTADNAVTFRTTLKAVAQQNGLYVTFMPKPIAGINGSGMHTHMSLTDKKTGENMFAEPNDEYGLSDIAKHFIAGLLAHAKGMCAVLAPLVNSYKRLVPGYEAPVYVSWARINRSALIRVPRVNVLAATRVELRCPDPSCNPYLAFAAMLAAGLDGVSRKLAAPAPREEDLYHLDQSSLRSMETLPGSLKEALDELEKDAVIREALGKHVYDRFYEAKLQEWNAYRLQVSPWELQTYLTTY